ncbi:hypothetical protein [Rubidibacter lacunae]|uniref:hypothetical protein n=1 Tax=Rubidibacter lacunae TaxID=582514 RepID=UPI00040C37F2|nr:hypothetical protein [Rubidibacter lacunae]
MVVPYPLILLVGVVALMFAGGAPITFGGLPPSIVFGALQDGQVRKALFSADSASLQQRLKEMEVDKQVDDYYSDRINDSRDRELYTDQIFYNYTGYHNEELEETNSGNLIWNDK